MKAVDDNASKKKDESALYTSWTLSFTAPTSEEAQKVLAGYIDYISALVVKESIENVRNKLEIKTQFEKEKLAQDRIKTKNQLDANIQRLNYSLDIANAAGIKSPYTVMVRPLKMTPISLFLSVQTVLNANWKLKKQSLTLRN